MNKPLPVKISQTDKFLSQTSPPVTAALGEIEGSILVLGAGGKMGLHVCSMIQASDKTAGRPNRVTAVSRFSSVHGRAAFEAQGIPCIACDLEDEKAVADLPEAPNIIFMAGAKFGTGDQPHLLRRMNEELPQRIAKRFAGARCLVFSTGCVYSMVSPASGGSRENDATDPPGAYAESCLQREQAFPLADASPFILNITGSDILSVKELAEHFGGLMEREPRFIGTAEGTAWLNNASKSHELFGKPQTSLDTMAEWTTAWLESGSSTLGKPTGFDNREGKF